MFEELLEGDAFDPNDLFAAFFGSMNEDSPPDPKMQKHRIRRPRARGYRGGPDKGTAGRSEEGGGRQQSAGWGRG